MQMTSTFLDVDWDFLDEMENGAEDIWWIVAGHDYPRLSWQYGLAFFPDPANGIRNAPRSSILQWVSGGPAMQHDIYFGRDADTVAGATPETSGVYRGRRATEHVAYDPGILEWGQTYYWRIDEVDELNPSSPWKGSLWSFRVPDAIDSPYPPDGAREVAPATSLTWVSGGLDLECDVYIGKDEHIVGNATPEDVGSYFGRQPLGIVTCEPVDLEWGETYYWRVDAVKEADPNSPWKGDVWSFTTVDHVVVSVVDDFESYGYGTSHWIDRTILFLVWLDGIEDPNNGGSQVCYTTGPCEEYTIVHGGQQSMPFFYDNDGAAHEREGVPFYSQCVRTWEMPQDWTIESADTLTLYFRGEPDNDPEPLYVRIEDTAGGNATATHPDADAVLASEWRKWHIALADLQAAGVDVAWVRKMIIGVGDRDNPQPGSAGLIYIDDIAITRRIP
jgi:hypothetical protein